MSGIKVHNAELYVEAMQSADWSLSEAQRRARAAAAAGERAGGNGSSSSTRGGGGGGSSSSFRSSSATRHTDGGAINSAGLNAESLAGKRAVLEAEFKAKMDIAKRESDRRSHEKAVRKDREFEEKFAAFMKKNKEIIAESTHEEVTAVRERRRERLYQEWMQNVFLPMQNEINSKIEAASADEIVAFRNQQYQAYLDECNRSQKTRGGGIHRDIVVETQYNPFVVNAAATVTYKSAPLSEDPLKNRVTRETAQSAGSGGSSPTRGNNNNNNNTSRHSAPPATTTSHKVGATAKVAGGVGASTARQTLQNGNAQSLANTGKFQLLPSEALGTVNNNNNGSGAFGGGLNTSGVASSSSANHANQNNNNNHNQLPPPRAPRFLPSVGGVPLTLSYGGNATANTSTGATVANNLALSSASHGHGHGGSDIMYKYSANNSLFNPAKEVVPLRGAMVDVKQWSRMDATPHGRYSDDNRGPTGRPRVGPAGAKADFGRSDVVFDHYNVPKGEEGVRKVNTELTIAGKGKKCGYLDHATENPIQ